MDECSTETSKTQIEIPNSILTQPFRDTQQMDGCSTENGEIPVEMAGSLLREDVPPGTSTLDHRDKSDWRLDWRHPEPMYVRCPICFVGDPSREKPDRAVVVLDGNFNQKRLAGKSVLGRNKRSNHRLFVTPNSSPRYMSKDADKALDKCATRFKAVKNPPAADKYEDTGMIAALCSCGIVLRLYNVSKTGERLAYGHRLIDEILADPSCPKQLYILYDVNCVFSKYLRTRMENVDYARLKFGIGLFHVYAHEYTCQVLFSPRGLVGLGWIEGEICERYWGWNMHFIPPNRSASAYTRLQILTHSAIEIGDWRLLAMPKILCKSFANAFMLEQEAEKALTTLQAHGITEDLIKEQYEKMRSYFLGRQAAAAVDPLGDLFKYIRGFQNAKHHLCELLETGVSDWGMLGSRVNDLNKGRVNDYDDFNAKTLRNKIKYLMEKHHQSWDEWIQPNGEPGPAYLDYEKKHDLVEARLVKHEIWEQSILRKFESARVHNGRQGLHSSNEVSNQIGYKHSQSMNESINRRYKRLHDLVKKYNKIVAKLSLDGYSISQLSSEKVENILDNDKFWELERLFVNERWALESDIRQGCAMMLQRDRVAEEIQLLEGAFRRFLQFHKTRLILIQSALTTYPEETLIHSHLKLEAEKSTSSIFSLQQHFRTLWEVSGRRRKAETLESKKLWCKRYGDKLKSVLEGALLLECADNIDLLRTAQQIVSGLDENAETRSKLDVVGIHTNELSELDLQDELVAETLETLLDRGDWEDD